MLIYSLSYFLGEPEINALQDQDISFNNEKSEPSERVDFKPGSNASKQRRFKCHTCEDSECSPPSVCNDAITVKLHSLASLARAVDSPQMVLICSFTLLNSAGSLD